VHETALPTSLQYQRQAAESEAGFDVHLSVAGLPTGIQRPLTTVPHQNLSAFERLSRQPASTVATDLLFSKWLERMDRTTGLNKS
jgi:hypothetical protein